jgi:hypothetical protein
MPTRQKPTKRDPGWNPYDLSKTWSQLTVEYPSHTKESVTSAVRDASKQLGSDVGRDELLGAARKILDRGA